ncbi:hypothetical protein KBI23_01890 [bacterium]|nr:hypothetical protein [bacterium]MBP9808782.1 hypothetical protein [bacterium]
MLHIKLLELESEIIAKEEAARAEAMAVLPAECDLLKQAVEHEIGLHLADIVASDWRGWLTYRRGASELIIIRGRAFKESGMFGKVRAGLDFSGGLDSIADYVRQFDVSAPQDLDHLMINFGVVPSSAKGLVENSTSEIDATGGARVFLWYGEDLAPYRLIFEDEVSGDPEHNLLNAVAEGLSWIVAKPKELTLPQFLKQKK